MSRLLSKAEPKEKLFRVVFDSVSYYVQAESMSDAIVVWQQHMVDVHGHCDGEVTLPEEAAIVDDAPVITRTHEITPGMVQVFSAGTTADYFAAKAAAEEVQQARQSHKPMNSVHEAYAVILEELEEFWEEVRRKKALRNTANMSKELTQIAAMALRAKADLNLLE